MSRGAKAVQLVLGEGPTEVTLWLEYNFEVLALLEDILDMDMDAILDQIGKNRRLKFNRGVFWAGLTVHQPALTSRDAGGLFGLKHSERIGLAIVEAFAKANATEAAEGDADPPLPPATASDGT